MTTIFYKEIDMSPSYDKYQLRLYNARKLMSVNGLTIGDFSTLLKRVHLYVDLRVGDRIKKNIQSSFAREIERELNLETNFMDKKNSSYEIPNSNRLTR